MDLTQRRCSGWSLMSASGRIAQFDEVGDGNSGISIQVAQ